MRKFAALLFILAAFLTGCKDETNPVEQEEHFEPEGWLFEDSTGSPVLVVWQAEIQTNWDNQNVSGRLSIGTVQLKKLKVKFLNSSKTVMEYPGTDYTLDWLITDNNIASVSQDITDKWSFILNGLTSGTTTTEVRVLHGGHADVKTPLIPIDVF